MMLTKNKLQHWKIVPPVLAIFIIVLFACTGTDQGGTNQKDISQQEAIDLVIQEVVQPKTLDHHVIVFALPDLLTAGDRIGPYNKLGYKPHKTPTEIQDNTWFFWIDDAPAAHFMHKTRFVFVDHKSGEISTRDEMWWPVLNGEGLWTTREEYWNEDYWVYSNTSYRPNFSKSNSVFQIASPVLFTLPQETSPGSAIVINGWESGESGEEDFSNDADGMHDALEGAGFDVTYLGPPEDENPDRDGEPTTGSRYEWFEKKAKEMQPCQTLVVFITGHGGVSEGTGGVGPVYEDYLQNDLEKFNPGVHIIVVVNGCSSGSFVDTLMQVADVTITATGAYDPSYGDIDTFVDDPNPDDKGSEFVSGFVEDFNEIMKDESQQEEAQQRAKKSGTHYWEEVFALAYLSAVEKDAAYQEGWTFPQAVRGVPGTKPTPSLTPTQTATPEPTETALSTYGKYLCEILVAEDKANHEAFIKMPSVLEIILKEGSLIIAGPFPWVTVSGDLNTDGSFNLSGQGTVAGFNNIVVTFQGIVSSGELKGNYTMGAEGGLPKGESITYSINGEQIISSETPEADSAMNKLQAFASVFNASFQNGDVDSLFALLHPAVIERYGSDACQNYLSTVVTNPVQIEILEIESFEAWDWELDGQTTQVEDVYTVQIMMTAQSQSEQSTIHFGQLNDGSITWFTDCGDPLP